MSIRSALLNAAKQNAELLDGLAATEHASNSVTQSNDQISHLQDQIQQTSNLINILTARTKKELKEHEHHSKSHFRKNLSRFTGKQEKFLAEGEREEREYTNALQEEESAKQRLDNMEDQLRNAEAMKSENEATAMRHMQLQRELDSLYGFLFDGHTPEYPEEDQKELATRNCQTEFNHHYSLYDAEAQTTAALKEAYYTLERAKKNMDQAQSDSGWDAFAGGASASMVKDDLLRQIQAEVAQAQRQITKAQQLNARIEQIPELGVPQPDFVTDVVFDNIFTDISVDNKIYESSEKMRRAFASLKKQLTAQEQREEKAKDEMEGAKQRYDAAKMDLQCTRQGIIYQVLQGS